MNLIDKVLVLLRYPVSFPHIFVEYKFLSYGGSDNHMKSQLHSPLFFDAQLCDKLVPLLIEIGNKGI